MDKEIIEKIAEIKELNKVLFLDHDESKSILRANIKKLNEIEDSMLDADKKFDRQREKG